jgi:hypothetical protein
MCAQALENVQRCNVIDAQLVRWIEIAGKWKVYPVAGETTRIGAKIVLFT